MTTSSAGASLLGLVGAGRGGDGVGGRVVATSGVVVAAAVVGARGRLGGGPWFGKSNHTTNGMTSRAMEAKMANRQSRRRSLMVQRRWGLRQVKPWDDRRRLERFHRPDQAVCLRALRAMGFHLPNLRN